MKKQLCFTLAALCTCVGFAVEKIDFTADKATWSLPPSAFADGKIAVKGKQAFAARKRIPIDPQKRYTLNAVIAHPSGSAAGEFAAGFLPLDKNGKPFFIINVNTVRNSDTELISPCRAGDKVLKVKDASKWRPFDYWFPTFNGKSDFSDLPNHEVERTAIEKIEKTADGFAVTFKKPFSRFYPAGTPVRLHSDGGIMYCFRGNAVESDAKHSGKLHGISVKGVESGKWWPGTAQAYPYIYTNIRNQPNAELHLKSVTVEVE